MITANVKWTKRQKTDYKIGFITTLFGAFYFPENVSSAFQLSFFPPPLCKRMARERKKGDCFQSWTIKARRVTKASPAPEKPRVPLTLPAVPPPDSRKAAPRGAGLTCAGRVTWPGRPPGQPCRMAPPWCARDLHFLIFPNLPFLSEPAVQVTVSFICLA